MLVLFHVGLRLVGQEKGGGSSVRVRLDNRMNQVRNEKILESPRIWDVLWVLYGAPFVSSAR